MLRNFHLAAITKVRSQIHLLQIPLHQKLGRDLATSWKAQHDTFVDNVEEVDFSAGYNLEEHQRFRLSDYEAPEWLARENSQTIEHLDPIAKDDRLIEEIKGTVAMARDIHGEEIALFQNFTKSKVIKPGTFLFLKGSTYRSIEHPGLTLGGALSAAYYPERRKLLFNNFRSVNTFLPLADLYQEASEQEIKEVLCHPILVPEDLETTTTSADQWFRKRFAMLKDSGILDSYSVVEIQSQSLKHGVAIDILNGRIVFPAAKAEAKKVLQFLNEELYHGPITQTLYETNSKKKAEF